MKKLIFLTCLIASPYTIRAQQEFYVSVFTGVSKIASIHSTELETFSNSRISDRYLPGLNINLNYSFHLGKLKLETGLGYTQIQGLQTESFNLYTDDTYLNYYRMEVVTERKSHNLILPLTAHFQLDQLDFGLGFYANYLLTDEYFISFSRDEQPMGFQGGGNQLKKADVGFNSNMSFYISEHMKIKASVLYGFTNLNQGTEQGAPYFVVQLNPQERELKNRQFLLGLTYSVFKKDKKVRLPELE